MRDRNPLWCLLHHRRPGAFSLGGRVAETSVSACFNIYKCYDLIWVFDPAIAGPRGQGGSRGLERLKELQTREGWLGQLWRETGKEADAELLGCARKDQQRCCWWREALPQLPALGEGLPLLHSTVVWVTCSLRAHHQSPSLCPHSIPCHLDNLCYSSLWY